VNSLLSVGDQIESGVFRFHSRFNRAVNFERHGRLVSVVDEQIGPGPLNIVLRGGFSLSPSKGVRAGVRGPFSLQGSGAHCALKVRGTLLPSAFPPLKITASSVVFAAHRFPFSPRQRYHSTFDFAPGNLHCFHHNLSIFGGLLTECAPSKSLAFLLDETRLKNFRSGFEQAFADRICRGAHQVFHGRRLEGIRSLKGCGLGLTPSGDDFIAGLLIGLNLLQKLHGQAFQPTADAVFGAAEGDNIFSNTFLDLARRGLLFGRMKDLLLVLMTGNEASVRKVTGKLFAIGASSGADLATGFFLTVHEQSRPVERGCQRQPMDRIG
jgi:hypothetical protein